ncbi:MAG: DUF1264 domain-containing protein [Nitrososphaeraceae archaeon]
MKQKKIQNKITFKSIYVNDITMKTINTFLLLTMALVLIGSATMSVQNIFAEETNSSDTLKYNEMLNPRQVEYPAVLGFNDLHIEAINHIDPNSTSGYDAAFLDVVVHHHCKVYDDMTATCLLFPTGMGDQDKPYGIEYVISTDQYNQLPDEEKKYWHYHLTELPNVHATLPDMTEEEIAAVKPVLDETYGKIFYFWQLGDEFPIGEPKVIMIEDLVKAAEEQNQNNNTNIQ